MCIAVFADIVICFSDFSYRYVFAYYYLDNRYMISCSSFYFNSFFDLVLNVY